MKYTCNKCSLDWPRVEPHHTKKSMCKVCYKAIQAEGNRRRKEEIVIDWDYELSFKWMWLSFRGYSMRHANINRIRQGKEAVLYNGCYKQRYMK